MRHPFGHILATLALLGLLALPPVLSASPPGMSASVNGPPEVQRVGNSYVVVVNVRNSGGWIPRLCLDWGDSDNSWKIVMPGLRGYKDDVFCFGTLRGKRKQFIARIVAAKTGQKPLEICLGRATSYSNGHAWLEDNQLCWHDSFVLV